MSKTERQPVIDIEWQEFGRDLCFTYDLDPIYAMLAAAELPWPLLKRWMLAYWCYYSAATASRIAECSDFYAAMWQAQREKWPHGFERRHFWGDQAYKAITGLATFGTPEQVVDAMTRHRDFQTISRAVQSFTGFGPWMAWKIADMAERVLNYPVDFTNSELGVYKDPVQGAAFILYGDKHHIMSLEDIHYVVSIMEVEFEDVMAPPYQDRSVNIQEIETILCKYKAHCYGFYPYGNDSHHIAKGFAEQPTQLGDYLYRFLAQNCSYIQED